MVQKLSDKTILLLITTHAHARIHTRTRIIELSTIIKRLASANYIRVFKQHH